MNVSGAKGAAVKDIDDISISPIFWGHKYRYRIDIGKGDIDPSLLYTAKQRTMQIIGTNHV